MKKDAAALRLARRAGAALGLAIVVASGAARAQTVSPNEVRSIVRDATIYGFPLVDNYRVQYSFFVDRGGPEFKAGWNTLVNNARLSTPDDKTVQTPNADTPYSFFGADLRTEPLVVSVPPVDKGRYYSLQFIDMYTYNIGYVGSRATGNGAGNVLLAGPYWNGTKPEGFKTVIRSDTDFVFVIYRTQLFNVGDLDNVKKIQAGYRVQPLSQFMHTAAPAPAPGINFIKPLTPEQERSSLDFFKLLNFVLQFCPANQSEEALMARFAKIGIGAGRAFDPNALTPEMRRAFQDGLAEGFKAFADYKTANLETGKKTSGDLFGSRAFLKTDYMARMAGAILGIYGNSKEEAFYPSYFNDADGQKLTGANRYTLHFAADQMPPVNAFWSLTMYELPQSLLYANPLNRYLINSPMLPSLVRDADGGITLYVQNASPGKDKEANWLPAPKGPFSLTLRLYWPKPTVYNGKWMQPPLQRAN